MDRVVLDRSRHVEARLFEAEAHAAGAREQIDADGPAPALFHVRVLVQF